MDLCSHSRNSSVSGSLVSQNSNPYVKNRRRNVGDRVTITSDSKVYLNHTENADVNKSVNENVNSTYGDINFSEISNSIRTAKDLPKLKNRIFEDSIESQEISFYIEGTNSDDEHPDYENVVYDSFESDSDCDYVNITGFQAVELVHDVTNTPLPPEPVNRDANGFDKLTKNITKFRKNFSRDITKSLRRFSKKIYQTDMEVINRDKRKPLTNTNEPEKQQHKISSHGNMTACRPKSDSFLTRIRRSVSLSTVSVTNLATYFETQDNTQNQRQSTFYLTDPIDIENNENKSVISSSVRVTPSKPKIMRPKMPPPPVPSKDAVIEKIRKEKETKKETTKLSTPKYTSEEDESERTSWYTEAGLYTSKNVSSKPLEAQGQINKTRSLSNTITSDAITKNVSRPKLYSSVIEELNYKLNKNNGEQINDNVINNFENESIYNNQSVYSYSSNDSKRDDSSLASTNHDNLFEDEPLYQFYDAAIMDSSFHDTTSECGSDIYEDVMEENNENYISSSTIADQDEMANKSMNETITFTRSLWCEAPEVMKSTVLSTLNSQQKKLQEAKFEIITSEASYLHSLNLLVDHFEKKFKKSNIVNEKEFEILFSKIRAVRACSRKIFHDFQRCWQNNVLLDGLCDLVQRHANENFQVYVPYCENQIVISETLNKLKERPEFSEFLSQLESSPICQFLTLYSFLMLPMQRITRWPLLMDAVLKRLSESDPEYLTCQYALAILNKTVMQCNEAARQMERELELRKMSNCLEFDKDVPTIEIYTQGRYIIKTGSLMCYQPRSEDTRMTFGRRFSKTPLYLFLLNDLFVVTKKKSECVYTVIQYCHRNLIELRSIDRFPALKRRDVQDKHLLYLSILENHKGKVVEYLLSASTETDKERWIEAISPPKSENPDETLYECWDCPQVTVLHNYNGCQPDELSLSRGDVINVLRKMTDGWYHGERIRDGHTGWFPANHTEEIINPHVRARNLKQRYRLLTFSENYLKT